MGEEAVMEEAPKGFDEVLAEVRALVLRKQLAYRHAWRAQGWRGNVGRVLSKASGLRALLWSKGNPPVDNVEPAEDTLLDTIALCVFALINLRARNEWGYDDLS